VQMPIQGYGIDWDQGNWGGRRLVGWLITQWWKSPCSWDHDYFTNSTGPQVHNLQ